VIETDFSAKPYRGRFAPSPTGPLHVGSLVAAVGSYLDARAAGGEWLLRIEDVDAPRCTQAAANDILHALEVFGFEWDGPVVWQSQRDAAYGAALDGLIQRQHVFPCACSRRELADSAFERAADGASLYPGTCRNGLSTDRNLRPERAWRLRVGEARIEFGDRVQGAMTSDLASDVGDFVLRRADGLFAYQLAVVVDDADAQVTHVVRGCDLLASTARQIYLQQCLGLSTPIYAHLPVVLNADGEKLSKQTRAPALNLSMPEEQLLRALTFLGQKPLLELRDASLAEVWRWAIENWSLAAVCQGDRTGVSTSAANELSAP
jgi:glutamyl-Q tRNA(Asp) synthetase